MESSVLKQIVNILLKDQYLDANRIRFYDSLSLLPANLDKLKSLELYEFFSNTLIAWNSRNGISATVHKLWEIMKDNQFQLVADQLKETFPLECQQISNRLQIQDEKPVAFEVIPEVRNFAGRSKELKKLEELFLGNQEYVATVTGMGGIGKSELAKCFAYHLHKEHNITIIWFNGQNRATLQASVNRLAKRVQTNTKDLNSNNMEKSFLESIDAMPSKMEKRRLVIIDNVDEANEDAESLIKAEIPEKDCFFLITSRNLKVLKLAGQIIPLDIFPDEDAQHLVSSSLKVAIDEDVRGLCKLLDNFPLALQQAVAYIREQKFVSSDGEFYQISDYVDSFATMKKELLGYELNLEHDYELTTLITWKVTMDKIEKTADIGELAIAILSAIAYFQPDRIHMGLLQLFFKDNAVREIEKAIQLIKTYSLVKGGQKLISIHRLLQQVIQLNIADKNLEVQRLRKITNSILRILEDGDKEIQRIQPKLIIENLFKYSTKIFDTNPLLSCIRSGIRHLLSILDHNCKHPDLITEFKGIHIKIINVVYPLRAKFRRIEDITYFTNTSYTLFKTIFGPNAKETLELESEVAFASGPKINGRKLKKLDDIYERQTSVLGVDNELNLKLLEKISYSICKGCYSGSKIRYGKYLKEFLRLREKFSGPGHESTFPVRWELIEKLDAKDPELLAQLNELLEKGVRPADRDQFIPDMKQYGRDLFEKKKYEKANYFYELWLGCISKGYKSAGGWRRADASWKLSFMQYILGDRESAFQTLLQFVVGWEDREKEPKLFVEMRSECERGDGKVREGALEDALRLFERVNDYHNSLEFPLVSQYNWWRRETLQKRASVLIQLRRCKEALDILQNRVRWDIFVGSDHKLEIERNELLKEAEEGLRLEEEAAKRDTVSPSKRPRLET